MEEKELYRFHGQFVYRTPAIPFQPGSLDGPGFFKYTQNAVFKEAIYLASPVLYDELVKWHEGLLTDKKEISRLVLSLYKYHSRMQSRCTPYGLFAGCGTGSWGDGSSIVLQGKAKRHTRLDMNYLCALAQQLNHNPLILARLKFFPNNSLYEAGSQLRYVEYKYVNNKRVHQISSVAHTDYLRLLIQSAGTGAYISDLKKLLVTDEITDEDASGFIAELIECQVLVSELEPAVTGDEFIYQVIRTLNGLQGEQPEPELAAIIAVLEEARQQIAMIDTGIGNDVGDYRAIYEKLKVLGAPIEENQLFQADLYKTNTSAVLDRKLQAQLNEAIEFLNKFCQKEENQVLRSFRERFFEQYESAEIPLAEALDTEMGIGYTGRDSGGLNLLLDDMFIPGAAAHQEDIAWNAKQDLLHRRLLHALSNNHYTVTFTDDDIKSGANYSAELPDSLPIMFRVTGDKLFFQSCGGSGAANLLGRFAHGSEAIHHIINDITAHEQLMNPGRILAEIVHLPESRIGNILLRPVLRDYELPYLGKSALPAENQVPLQDLVLSVRNDRIILRSRRLNKEVIPRLSTAHNYTTNALPVYQFLGDMQRQYFEKQRLEFSWGPLAHRYKFLPRAEYKHVILKRARWNLDKDDFSILLDDKHPGFAARVAEWRELLNLPRQVILVDFDNELLVDFADPVSIDMFVGAIKKRPAINLEEFLFDAHNLLIKDSEGQGYTNEFIGILLKQEAGKSAAPHQKQARREAQQRLFGPGSEWLYYKIYCGIKTADKLLPEVIRPMTEEIAAAGWADRFFFIRFADPGSHIRLRFHISDPANIGHVMSAMHRYLDPCLSKGMVSKLQADTYRRELERYGHASIGFSEAFFHIDSVTALNMLDLIDGEEGEEARWQFALRSIDELLDDFGYDFAQKLALLEKLRDGFVKEHGGSKELKLQLDLKFRNVRKAAESILDRGADAGREIFPLIELLRQKRLELREPIAAIRLLNNTQALEPALDELLGSYIHMMLNRLFMSRQRTNEMVIYDLLCRCYKSGLARAKQTASHPKKIAV